MLSVVILCVVILIALPTVIMLCVRMCVCLFVVILSFTLLSDIIINAGTLIVVAMLLIFS